MLNQSIDLDHLFHALADPARRAMVERLSRGPAPVTELARPLPMSLPAAMQHLAVLEVAGLVRSSLVRSARSSDGSRLDVPSGKTGSTAWANT